MIGMEGAVGSVVDALAARLPVKLAELRARYGLAVADLEDVKLIAPSERSQLAPAQTPAVLVVGQDDRNLGVAAPTVAVGALTLADTVASPTLRVEGEPTPSASRLTVAVEAGTAPGTFRLRLRYGGVLVETFDDLATPAAAAAALDASGYARAVDLASPTPPPGNQPAIAAAAALSPGGGPANPGADHYLWAYRIRAFAYARGREFDETSARRNRYGLAIREALMERPWLADGVQVDPMTFRASYSDVGAESTRRSLAGVWVEFTAHVVEAIAADALGTADTIVVEGDLLDHPAYQ